MKKILIGTSVFSFAFLLTAASVLAWGGGSYNHYSNYQQGQQTNYAHDVLNYIEASSFTGDNAIGKAEIDENASIDTGNAVSSADGTNAINSNWVRMTRTNYQKNMAMNASNGIGSYSSTGNNAIGKADIDGASIITGNAASSASGMNLINTNVQIGGGFNQ